MLAGLTAAWGRLAWLLDPFRASTGRKVGVEFDVLDGIAHPSEFSRRMIAWLESRSEPVILWSCVDMFVDKAVDPATLESLARYMVQRGDVVRMGITVEHWPWERVDTWGGLEIGQCANLDLCSIHAGMIMDFALFDRVNMLKILEPSKSLWEVEREGTEMVLRDPFLCSLTVRPGLFGYVGLSHQDGWFEHLDLLGEEDRALVLDFAPGWVKWYE